MAVPTTVKEFLNTMFSILDLKTFYENVYPYNLGYYNNNGYFSFDCVNLLKAVLNGWEAKKTAGYFVKNLSRTGDCTEAGLINQCTEVSGDFTKLHDVSVLYMNGHIGCFVGEFIRNGKKYNTIECTSNSWGDGVIATYTDSKGRRLREKGSTSQIGTWTKHGKMTKWLKYPEQENFDYKKATRIAVKIERGDYGNNPKRQETITKNYGKLYYDAAQGMINYLHKNF